jgi:hypothetical protein
MVGYQNYLAQKLNFQLLNIKNHNNSPEQTLIDLINNGTFNSLGVKTVIIEKVERFFIDGLKNIDFTSKINYKYIFTSNHNLPNKKPVLQRATSWIRLSLGYENPVKTAVLRDTLFTHTTLGSTLFFYQNDLNFQRISDSDIKLASHNLKKLNRFCLKNKVQLIYLLAADKYDIYQPFIVNSNYPGNHVLDLFSKNIEESYFINTKELLQPLLAKGVKDIYKLNDSHWSPKGHEIVANELYKRLVNMNLK